MNGVHLTGLLAVMIQPNLGDFLIAPTFDHFCDIGHGDAVNDGRASRKQA